MKSYSVDLSLSSPTVSKHPMSFLSVWHWACFFLVFFYCFMMFWCLLDWDGSNSVPESLGFDLIHSGPGAWSCSSPRTRFGLDFRVSAMTEPNKDIRTNGQLPVGTVTMPQWFSSLYSAPLLPSPIPGPPQPPYPSQTPPLQTHTFYSTHSSGTLCSLGPSPTDWHGHKRGKLLSSRAASVFPDLLWDRAEWGPSCCTKPPAGHRTGGVMSSVVIGKGFVWSTLTVKTKTALFFQTRW